MSPDARSSASRCPRWLKETVKLTAAAAAGFGIAFMVNGSGSNPAPVHHVTLAQAKEASKASAAPAAAKPLPAHLAAVSQLAEAFELARTDSDELRRRIGTAKDPKERLPLIRGLFAYLADHLSPKDAIAEALKFTDADQETALKELAAVWLGTGPESLVKGGRSDGSTVQQAGLALIYSPNARAGAAEAWVQAFKDHSARLELLSALATKISASDPRSAMALGGGLTEWERQRFLDRVVVNWATGDPAAARKWMTDPVNAADAADRKFPWAGASYQHADWVAAALTAEKDPATRLEILRGLAAAMANKGTREALAWADSLTDPAEREAAHDRIYELTPRGIGAVLSTVDGYPLVNNVLPDSASARAGLQAGDRFIEVTGPDGKAISLYQQPLEVAVKNLQGEAGETISVRILRGTPGGTAEHTISITRGQLVFPSDFAQRPPK
jgi:hypothetical protein